MAAATRSTTEPADLRTAPVAAISVDADANPHHRLQHIEELADSIRTHGLLQPVLVRPEDQHSARYRPVAGLIGACLVALVENPQRDDLSARDEAEALGRLVREGWDRRQARAEARGYTAAFHPHLRAQVSGVREPSTSASLSMGERLMLRQFGELLLAQVPAVEDTPPS